MPMSESRQERWACAVVEARLGVDLVFVDTDGRVDYKFTDAAGRSAAMEVTTLTDQDLKVSVDTYNRTRGDVGPLPLLESCWSVIVDERDSRIKGLESQLEPHLALLESVGIAHGRWATPAEVRAEYRSAEVEEAVAVFDEKLVRLLMRWLPETCAEDEERRGPHSHGIQLSTGGDFVEVGKDVALETIEAFVAAHEDNLRKLSKAGADVKHLFVGLDEQTSPSISHSVSRRFAAPPVYGVDYFGLPQRPPVLPAEVDHLWVVYEREGQGWHWGDGRWEEVDVGR
jgi:hypothetical protein